MCKLKIFLKSLKSYAIYSQNLQCFAECFLNSSRFIEKFMKVKKFQTTLFCEITNLSDIDKIIKELIFSSYSSKISLVSGDGPDPPRSIVRENARFFLPNIFG